MDVRNNNNNKLSITKSGESVYTIDPAELTPDESHVLFFFLEKYLKDGKKNLISRNYYKFPFFSPESVIAEKLRCLGVNCNEIYNGGILFFTFTDTLVWRLCAKDPEDFRYDVYNGYILGHGAFAEIEEIKGTLVPQSNHTFHYKQYALNNTRVAKKQSEKELPRILEEYEFNRRVPELHVKKPTFLISGAAKSASYMVMRRLPGFNLDCIFKMDQEDKRNNIINISTDKRLRLAIGFLRALARLHLNKILHRDIKAANVIADFTSDVVRVTILDFGLSTDLLHPDGKHVVGTLLYAAPEVFEHKSLTIKSDIFCAAWVLAMLWRADDNNAYAHDSYRTAYAKVADNSHHVKFYNLFAGITDLDDAHWRIIADVLEKMVLALPGQRCDLDSAIQAFEKILLQRLLKTVGNDLHKNLENGFYAGIKLRATLDAFPAREYNKFNSSFSAVRQAIGEAVKTLSDSPRVIATFVDQAGFTALRGLATRKQIADTVSSLISTYEVNLKKLTYLSDQSMLLIHKLESEYGKRIEQGMVAGLALHTLRRKTKRLMSQAEMVNLDTICAATIKFDNYIKRLEAEITQVCERFGFTSHDIESEREDRNDNSSCFCGLFSHCGLFGERKKIEDEKYDRILVRM